jgi:hypothetical protein
MHLFHLQNQILVLVTQHQCQDMQLKEHRQEWQMEEFSLIIVRNVHLTPSLLVVLGETMKHENV